jgi:hypothetical protein
MAISREELTMYASVAKFRFTRPVETGDFEVNERVLVPLLKRQPGYQGYFEVLAGERETLAITLWASQSEADHGLAAIRPQLMELFGADLAGPPERVFGEVTYADAPVVNARA